MEGYFKSESKEVPQINSETGISQDYSNQLNAIVTFLKSRGMDFLKNILKDNPFHMKKYEEFYFEYKNVVNDKNRESVKKLDELVVQMNEILKDPDLINEDSFLEKCNEFYFLIYGKKGLLV